MCSRQQVHCNVDFVVKVDHEEPNINWKNSVTGLYIPDGSAILLWKDPTLAATPEILAQTHRALTEDEYGRWPDNAPEVILFRQDYVKKWTDAGVVLGQALIAHAKSMALQYKIREIVGQQVTERSTAIDLLLGLPEATAMHEVSSPVEEGQRRKSEEIMKGQI